MGGYDWGEQVWRADLEDFEVGAAEGAEEGVEDHAVLLRWVGWLGKWVLVLSHVRGRK